MNLGCRGGSVALKARIPFPDFFPSGKRGEFDRGCIRASSSGFCGCGIRRGIIRIASALYGKVRALPLVNFSAAGFVLREVRIRRAKNHFSSSREIDFQTLVENDGRLDEIMVVPELSFCEWRGSFCGDAVFEDVAGMKGGNFDARLFEVCIGGRIA